MSIYHMIPQRHSLCKSFVTKPTHIRFFASVRAHVLLEVAFGRELLAAGVQWTHQFFVMKPLMQVKLLIGLEIFRAYLENI